MTGRAEKFWLKFVKWPPEVDSGLAQWSSGSGSQNLTLSQASLPEAQHLQKFLHLPYPPRIPLPTTQAQGSCYILQLMTHTPVAASVPGSGLHPCPLCCRNTSPVLSFVPSFVPFKVGGPNVLYPVPLYSLVKPSLLVVSSNLLS